MQYPATVNLPRILKGKTWDPEPITYKLDGAAVNLTGCQATLKIKQGTTTLVSMTSTPAAGITLGGTAGTIALLLTATATAALTTCADAVYELELLLADSATVRSLMVGRVSIVEEVAV